MTAISTYVAAVGTGLMLSDASSINYGLSTMGVLLLMASMLAIVSMHAANWTKRALGAGHLLSASFGLIAAFATEIQGAVAALRRWANMPIPCTTL
jgi:hypothetical protein